MSAKLVLVRGLPGSGKSTLADVLCEQIMNDSDSVYNWAESYEADHYWLRPDGTYDFNARFLGKAHEWCQSEVQEYVDDGLSDSITCYALVSNTFTTLKEMQPYLSMLKNVRDIRVVHCINNYGSIHDVPSHTINKMEQRWQDTPSHLREIKYDGENFDEVLDFVLA